MSKTQTSDSAKAVLTRAIALHRDGRRDQAVALLDAAGRAAPQEPGLFAAKAHILFEAGHFDEAIASYQRALSSKPGDASLNFSLGLAFERLSRWNEAGDALEKTLTAEPQHQQARLGLAICLLHQQRAEEALDNFDRLIEQGFEDRQTAEFGKAIALQLLCRYDEAVNLYGSLLARNPQNEGVLSNLLALGMARKDEALVSDCAERLLAINGESGAATAVIAAQAFATGDYAAAVEHYATLVAESPTEYERNYNLAVALDKAGRADEAAEAYRKAIRIRPDAKQAHLNLGVVLHRQGSLEQACDEYRKVLAIAPDFPAALFNQGLAATQEGKADEAEQLFLKVTTQSPDFDDAWFHLGYLRLARGDGRGRGRAF